MDHCGNAYPRLQCTIIGGMMKRWLATCLATTTLLVSAIAFAAFHLFTIEQVYSNADGTIQFVVLTTSFDGENMWAFGAKLSSTDTGGATRNFSFSSNLPNASTGGKKVLVATQGFADLGIVAPDFIIPNHFISTGPGSVTYSSSTISYAALPTDGTNALYVGGTVAPNVATNFAGMSASVQPASALNFQGIWWAAPANTESGWGINFAHQGDTIFATWFTYDLTGRGTWFVMTAHKTGPNTYQGEFFETTGPAFDAVPFLPSAVLATSVGTGTLAFSDANNGNFTYSIMKGGGVNQSKAITRQVFGPLPTCTFGTQPNLALATNYQDLWWKAPAASESGWGINFNHEGDTIFATWFTYDHAGLPLWLVVTATKTTTGVYSGDLFRTTGPPFNAMPFNPALVVATKVGTATFTFTDGNNATFAYTVQLADMMTPVTQMKSITREIFSPPGTTCQ